MLCSLLQLARAEGRVILTAGQPYQTVSVFELLRDMQIL